MMLLAKTFQPVESEEMKSTYAKIFFDHDNSQENVIFKSRILRGMYKGYFRSDYVYLIVSNWIPLSCASTCPFVFAIKLSYSAA